MIDDVDAHQILQTNNIVGVAAAGPISDYPDPMRWRVDQVYVGCYVSLSDVLTVMVRSENNTDLFQRTPATNHSITTVIPFFDDIRILQFYRKYAPSILELTCGIGMRRILGEVPMTAAYTICASIWNIICNLELNYSEINIKTLYKLIQTYQIITGKYFNHIHEFILADDKMNINENVLFI